MDLRILQLIDAFENNGWTSAGSADIKREWWFEDVILLVFKWHPIGTKLYLTLRIDPLPPQLRMNKKAEVWLLELSTGLPGSKTSNAIRTLSLNEIKKTDLNKFVKEINASFVN